MNLHEFELRYRAYKGLNFKFDLGRDNDTILALTKITDKGVVTKALPEISPSELKEITLQTYTDFKYINDLPGKKIFLKGNHDYWWGTKSKIEKFLDNNKLNSINILFNNTYVCDNKAICGTRGWFLENESDADVKVLNREVGRLEMSISEAEKTGLEPVVFLHYPPVYCNTECSEIMNVLLKHNIKRCYYGHIHGKSNMRYAVEGDYKGINFKLISCDRLAFMPILVR